MHYGVSLAEFDHSALNSMYKKVHGLLNTNTYIDRNLSVSTCATILM